LVTIGADERTRWLTAAYREAPIKDRPRNFIGMLKDVPPAEMEAMLYAEAKADDDQLRLLANARAQAVKDALAAKGIAGERLFLIAPKLGSEGGAARALATPAATPAAPPAGPAPVARVDLALR
jgi:outer membrane protein OmpA-like peptidoglycan-associated protein